MMETLKLELALAEINQLLDVLGDRPYKEVYQLITKIQRQAEAQLKANDPQTPPHMPVNNATQTQGG
jgi:hypothetical protein